MRSKGHNFFSIRSLIQIVKQRCSGPGSQVAFWNKILIESGLFFRVRPNVRNKLETKVFFLIEKKPGRHWMKQKTFCFVNVAEWKFFWSFFLCLKSETKVKQLSQKDNYFQLGTKKTSTSACRTAFRFVTSAASSCLNNVLTARHKNIKKLLGIFMKEKTSKYDQWKLCIMKRT